MGSNDLARLIQASLPLPGRHIERTLLATTRLPHAAAQMPAESGQAAQSGAHLWNSHEAHSALKRALLDQTLATTVRTLTNDTASTADSARPYMHAVTDRAAVAEALGPAASEPPLRHASEPAFALNPALNSVASELMRTLMSPNKQRASSMIGDRAAGSSQSGSSSQPPPQHTEVLVSRKLALLLCCAAAACLALVFAVAVQN